MGFKDKALLLEAIRSHADQIRDCYETQLAFDPLLQGKVTVRWIIKEDGTASSSEIDRARTSLDDAGVQYCMMSRIATWRFPKPAHGGIAIVTHPWILKAPGEDVVEEKLTRVEPTPGVLDVIAPAGAEVWLDDRRVATGSIRRLIADGDHRLEVEGTSAVERFHVAPGEHLTFDATSQ